MSAFLRKTSLRPSIALVANVKHFRNTPVIQIQKTNPKCERVNPFSLAGMLKHYEILPLVVIIGVGSVAMVCYLVYFCKSRNDVHFTQRPSYDPMDLHNPPVLKMVKTREYTEYKPLTELDNLYKEMEAAEKEQQQKQK